MTEMKASENLGLDVQSMIKLRMLAKMLYFK